MSKSRFFILTIILVVLGVGNIAETQAEAQNAAGNNSLLSVTSFACDPTDLTANLHGTTVFDQNGDKCALIKIQTTETGFYFSCGMMSPVDVQYKVGEVWVYVPYGIHHLKIQHSKLGTLNYPFQIPIERAKTYHMELKSANVTVIVTPVLTQQWLIFQLSPKDAMVELDGSVIENKDGIAKKFVKFGIHKYVVSAPDYYSLSDTVKVDDAYNKKIVDIALKPAYGFLSIPEMDNLNGAIVYIDNKQAGNIPLRAVRLSSGSHTIRIIRSKYQPFVDTVLIEDGKTLSISPELQENFKRVTINAMRGSEVWINGEKVGISPWTGEVELGPCTIECRHEGYRPVITTTEITASSLSLISMNLPTPKYGSINIDSNQIKATVFIDGEEAGTTPVYVSRVLEGDHLVTLKKKGFDDVSQNVTVSEHQHTEVNITMVSSTYYQTANCYIVAPGQSVTFPAVKGNTMEELPRVNRMSVLWESYGSDIMPQPGDVVYSATCSGSDITVSAGSYEGNAVVAALDYTGRILWSWHIWVISVDLSQCAQLYNNNAGMMMDRNLGALSAVPGDYKSIGLLYQWGRKDPFLGPSSIFDNMEAVSTHNKPEIVLSDEVTGTIEFTLSHPTTFISSNSNNFDWYYSDSKSTDNTRWRDSNDVKGLYDPCPYGWRVPDGGDYGLWSKAFGQPSLSELVYFNYEKNGIDFGNNFSRPDGTLGDDFLIWYPSTGFFSPIDGSLGFTHYGYYWTCTTCDDILQGNAYRFGFMNSGRVSVSYPSSRASGLAVRCIKDNN